jgi:hypothetical protein
MGEEAGVLYTEDRQVLRQLIGAEKSLLGQEADAATYTNRRGKVIAWQVTFALRLWNRVLRTIGKESVDIRNEREKPAANTSRPRSSSPAPAPRPTAKPKTKTSPVATTAAQSGQKPGKTAEARPRVERATPAKKPVQAAAAAPRVERKPATEKPVKTREATAKVERKPSEPIPTKTTGTKPAKRTGAKPVEMTGAKPVKTTAAKHVNGAAAKPVKTTAVKPRIERTAPKEPSRRAASGRAK